MKNITLLIRNVTLAFSMLTFLSLTSCSPHKDFKIQGTVQSTENGKDGYTATLMGNDGNEFDAVFSKVALGEQYRVFTAGERLEVSGDTLHLNNRLRVIVKKIN
jgi:hypothetical protein